MLANNAAGLMLVMRAVLSAALLAGCVAYQPGTFVHEGKAFVGERVTVGCLDLAVARRPDMFKQAVIEYSFGNRCDKPEQVDLAYAKVMGRTASGSELRLIPYDPDRQLMAMRVDGRTMGHEALAYSSDEPLVQVCVDAASIVQRTPERWLCFSRVDASGEPTVDDAAATEQPATEQPESSTLSPSEAEVVQ
jgi:hypothetical protein